MAPTDPLIANSLNLDLESSPHAASGLEEKLFSVFVSYVPPESQTTATAAAAQIDSLLAGSEGEPQPDPWGFLHTFWDVYFRLGVQIEASEPVDRLVALVCALKELPTKVTSSDGKDKVSAWQNLPIMGAELSERWHQFDPKKMSPGSEHARRWYNMNGLLVKLDASGVRHSRREALNAIVLALEDNVNKQKKKHEVPAENVIASLLPASSLWLRSRDTAAKLLKSCHEGHCRGSGAHGPLWKLGEEDEDGEWSGGGFSVERWEFWRQRLEDLPKHKCADERTEEICRKVLETMAKVEVS
ncbi:hypothetical protein INS49_013375 [Diaporthe citri]|uniref:uncharacterized protein n=1 Tax=Diaporthe citri TaxID=83186 RepID=UPI001C80BEC8|nr:uncharacterized protein INS49_013375 [Diaporthe citri]KAG6357498.1 hypothetical protein INS49_013375 [Diaporthe citri]